MLMSVFKLFVCLFFLFWKFKARGHIYTDYSTKSTLKKILDKDNLKQRSRTLNCATYLNAVLSYILY